MQPIVRATPRADVRNQAEAEGLDWHAVTAREALDHWHTERQQGLGAAQVKERHQRFGPNTLETLQKVAWYVVLVRQFTDVLIIILLLAGGVALAIGELGDSLTIFGIVVLNGILGFVQEWKAEQAIEALQRMLAPRCKVLRDRTESVVDARELVPGDIVLLEIGDRVPADLRVIEGTNLRADESALTGESASVSKMPDPVAREAPLAARSSITWMGTNITNGRGCGVVVATGMQTEFGRIAHLAQTVGEERTPLQRRLATLGKQLGVFSVVISAVVALAGWLLGKPLLEMFLTGVALAVAVVPEGLPAVVTITLALGIRAMVKRRALLRRLQAAETLGAATVICTDKTGTLTQNEMTVTHVWLPAGELDVTGIGYEPTGQYKNGSAHVPPGQRLDLTALLETGLICNHARVTKDHHGWHEIGEPTEAALVTAAYKGGLHPAEHLHTVSEFSFNSARKRMTVIIHHPDATIAHAKGAPEVILERCTRIRDGEDERILTDADRTACTAAYMRMAERGLRTLALARRVLPTSIPMREDAVECELVLLGVVGMIDPARSEVPNAVRVARQAGVRVLMITGDAAATALAIARRIGLTASRAINGRELTHMSDTALGGALGGDVVFARTTPEHKLRIVSLLQKRGEIVGMTGDGVNDAPALKKADIGISMGLRGTDVAKGASDMVLTDDNFASIIGAIEEGRRQYDNIQKFVRYLLSSNTGEVVAICVNILLGGPLILLPVQILWMNLVTDGMTAVALGLEPPEGGIMERPPRSAHGRILNRPGIVTVLLLGGYVGAGTLWLFHAYLRDGEPQQVLLAQTVAFTGIIVLEKINVFNFRALREPMMVIGFFSNRWVLLAWMVTVGLQVGVVYAPPLQQAFHTVALGWKEWASILMVAIPLFAITEVYKWIRWRGKSRSQGRSGPAQFPMRAAGDRADAPNDI